MSKSARSLNLRVLSVILVLICAGLMSALAISRETPTGTVSGRVYSDDGGKPIPGAFVYHPVRDTYVKTDNEGRFTLYGVPQGKHSVRVSAKGFSYAYNNNVMVNEGKITADINFRMVRRASSFYMYAYQKVFSPRENPSIGIRGYLVKKIEIKAYKINPSHYTGMVRSGSNWANLDVSKRKPVIETLYTAKFNEDGDFEGNFTVPVKENGLYIITAKAVKGSLERKTWVLKTDLGLIAKRSPDEILVYAQSFSKGTPVENAAVTLFEVRRDSTVRHDKGVTGKNGVYFRELSTQGSLRAFAEGKEGHAFSQTYYGSRPDRYRSYVYTERPVYRPGQTVFFKGIIREKAGERYHVRQGIPVSVAISDSGGGKLLERTFYTGEFGTIHGSVNLPQEPPLGRYSLKTSIYGEDAYSSFQVSEYKKPEYKVEVTTDRPHYVAGDKINVKVKGIYYFGAPVKGASFNLTVYESAYRWRRVAWADYNRSDESGYGGIMFETSGKLDEKGEAVVTIPTGKIEYSRHLGIEAEVTDNSDRHVTGTTSAPLSVGEFALFGYTDRYVYSPGEEVRLKIEAMDYEEKPVKNQNVDVSIVEVRYEEVKQQRAYTDSSGIRRTYDEYNIVRKEYPAGSVRREITSDSGKADLSFTPNRAGNYEFQLSSKDSRKNDIKYTSYIYVSDGQSSGAVSEADLKIITDKKDYKKGDTVKAVISSSKPGTYVLVTLEGRRIFHHQVLHIKKGAETVSFPLKDDYFPNVYITATAIKNMDMVMVSHNIRMNRDEKKLNISVSHDKERYNPGDKAVFTVSVRDASGNPVKSEVSLGVVDQAIYAIEPDNTPDINEFFWSYQSNLVDTTFSFDKDYSGGADKFPQQKIRRKFVDTANWSPVLITDDEGNVKVEFEMPDNLTTWVSTVRGATADTQVGSAVNTVVCTKDLLVRLQTPRFMVQKDRLFIGGIVHNYTKTDQNVKVWLEARGVKLLGDSNRTATVKPGDAREFYFEAEAENPGTATFTLYCKGTGAEDAMEMTLPVMPFGVKDVIGKNGSINGDEKSESVLLKLPPSVVREASAMDIIVNPSIASTMFENLEYLIQYPYGCVEQTTSPVIAALSVRRAMKGIGISDRKLEEKIPLVIQKGLNRLYSMQRYDGGWGWWSGDEAHPFMTAYAVLALKMAQRNGYAVSDYNLRRGIEYLKKITALPPKPDKSLGGEYQQKEEWNTRSYLLYVLYRVGSIQTKSIEAAFENRNEMNEYALALLSMTLDGMGDIKRAGQVLDELDKKAISSDDQCYWDGRTFTYSWVDNNVESTAFCLMAYVQIRPDDPKIPLIISWLNRKRLGASYSSTKDTAAVIYALTDYLLKTGEHNPDYLLNVSLNGNNLIKDKKVDTFRLSPEDSVKTVDYKLLQTGNNQVDLSKNGQGSLYYTVQLSYFLQAEKIEPVSKGLQVKREYFIISHQKNRKGVIQEVLTPLADKTVRTGDKLRVVVTLIPDKDYRYMIVEDPLPGGFEVDMADSEKNVDSWLAHREVRDEKVAFFVRQIYNGKKLDFVYDLRPEMSGTANVLPATAYCMYEPVVRGHSGSSILKTDLRK